VVAWNYTHIDASYTGVVICLHSLKFCGSLELAEKRGADITSKQFQEDLIDRISRTEEAEVKNRKILGAAIQYRKYL
jgi:hypothetical protein